VQFQLRIDWSSAAGVRAAIQTFTLGSARAVTEYRHVDGAGTVGALVQRCGSAVNHALQGMHLTTLSTEDDTEHNQGNSDCSSHRDDQTERDTGGSGK